MFFACQISYCSMQFNPTDRILIIFSDTTIQGTTRIQKYGFLLHKQYGQELSTIAHGNKDLEFYSDWKPFRFGPFSMDLSRDLQACVSSDMVYKEMIEPAMNLHRYGLTITGRIRWRQLLGEFQPEITAIHEKIINLQKVRLNRLLQNIYYAYPEYAKRGTIKDKLG